MVNELPAKGNTVPASGAVGAEGPADGLPVAQVQAVLWVTLHSGQGQPKQLL